jgi:hypothetical protein
MKPGGPAMSGEDDPKKRKPSTTLEISDEEIAELFGRVRDLEEDTDPNLIETLQTQVRELQYELEHAQSMLALKTDMLNDMQRRIEMASLAEMTSRVEIERTHGMYRSIMHHLEIAITICYDPRSKRLWMSKKAQEITGQTNAVGAQISEVEDWNVFGRYYDANGKRMHPSELPLARALATQRAQLGVILFMENRWVHVDAYPVIHEGLIQAYAIWFVLDPQPDPPPNAIRDLLP